MFKLSEKSINRLDGVHSDLVAVVKRAIEVSDVDFVVGEGLRTVERQKELFRQGASKTMNSRHLTGKAVDLFAVVAGKITWHPAPYDKIADAMFKAANELNVPIVWGKDFKTLVDLVHFELDRKHYK